MSKYIVSARKYRPSTFDTVVGQESITSTLKNALSKNQLAQSFLFCGPRGVGKTTSARILAKTINCSNRTENFEACNECESCKSFNEGHSLNIYELDAASNNTVDGIRSLIEQVRFAPQLGDYKVYIIDEVHMLSQGAFNAFLKTLEEPPAHAIFILATTERHKILPTILSRCQIFNFKRIEIKDMVTHLAKIATEEGVQFEEDALHIVATKADGALRDALSIFDQLVSFSGGNLTYDSVIENLNVLDFDYYFKISESILGKNIPNCIVTLDEILSKGFDGHLFISGLGSHFRNILMCKDENTASLIETSDNIRTKYEEQAQLYSEALLMNLLNICSHTDVQYKSSKNQRLLLEVSLMQMCSADASILHSEEQKKKFKITAKFRGVPPERIRANSNTNKSTSSPSPAPSGKVINPTRVRVQDVKERLSTISINQVLHQKAQQPKVLQEEVHAIEEAFTEEEMQKYWKSMGFQYQDAPDFYSSITKYQPQLKEGFLIEYPFDNTAQIQDFEVKRPEMLSYLRSKLRNYSITIEAVLQESEGSSHVYTATEKFNFLKEKNPALEKLKDLLDLDIII